MRVGVGVLGITDHDTFAGHDAAVPFARDAGIRLICGIELSTKLAGRSVHVLGYFLTVDRLSEMRNQILDMQAARRDRNQRLIARLRELGFDITLAEVQARGRGLTARPHFAQVMVDKGYVKTVQQAFDDYLDESAIGYVQRQEPTFAEGVSMIRSAGGIASLAHPIRVSGDLDSMLPQLCRDGLNAIEVYHSDHRPELTARYLELAKKYGLLITGGSDFHGAAKPGLQLGTGRDGNLEVPADLFANLEAQRAAR